MTEVTRRAALHYLAAASLGVVACKSGGRDVKESGNSPANPPANPKEETEVAMSSPSSKDPIRSQFSLPVGRPWPTPDPFLFCVHHNDRFPRGNGKFGPVDSLAGRQLGMDFSWKDGWNMYHGMTVPGFPAHPHRGFETVTVVRQGRLDHADSLGAAARYGDGDVQWLTAGSGIVHAEMFPLLSSDQQNPLDLFQIWLNLPRRSKMVSPYFSMHWAHQIPLFTHVDSDERRTQVEVRAGRLGDVVAPPAPPDSWAHSPENEVGIWTGKMDAGATWTLPPASGDTSRFLYFFSGDDLRVGDTILRRMQGAELDASVEVSLQNGGQEGEFLILQGKPIGEPVAHSGPFVMNTEAELRQAYQDYRTTRFGGWPWSDSGPVHGHDPGRFARNAAGEIVRPQTG